MKEDGKIYLSWNDFEAFLNDVCMNVKYNGRKFSGVFGLPRGGLVAATCLSHRLGIPMLMAPAKGCLIVDDIADSGITLQHYAESKDNFIVTWVYKPKSVVTPNYFTKTVDSSDWIVFPWEANA